jgi:hypothetical protein
LPGRHRAYDSGEHGRVGLGADGAQQGRRRRGQAHLSGLLHRDTADRRVFVAEARGDAPTHPQQADETPRHSRPERCETDDQGKDSHTGTLGS